MTAIHLYATLDPFPGQRDQVRALLVALAAQVRAEPGNVRFVIYTLRDDPERFHVEESYRDAAAFQAHMDSAHGRTFNEAVGPFLRGGRSDVVFLDPVD